MELTALLSETQRFMNDPFIREHAYLEITGGEWLQSRLNVDLALSQT